MARESYGADVFSPVRGNALDEYAGTQVDSDSFEQLPSLKKEHSEFKKKNKRPGFSLNDITPPKNNGKTNNPKQKKEKSSTLETSCAKDKLSFVTTRSKSHLKIRKESEKIQETQKVKKDEAARSSKKRTEKESDKNRKLLPTSFSSTLLSVSEEKSESNQASNLNLNILKPSNKNHPDLPALKIQRVSSDEDTNSCEQNQFEKNCSGNKANLSPETFPGENLIIDSNVLDEEKEEESSVQEVVNAMKPIVNLESTLGPIQANIIEKLVNDAVSFQLDGIRQQMYTMHLSLIGHMDRNADDLEQLVKGYFKVIEDLVDENRKLKNTIISMRNS